MKQVKKKNKILSFERDAKFLFDRHQKLVDRGEYIESLVSLRGAVQKEPDNTEYRLSLAELYTEMNDYEKSNYILFELLREQDDLEGVCLFDMGCNFFGLRDAEKASECFERYLMEYPDGEFACEAQDLLELMDDEVSEEEDAPDSIYEKADQGKTLLDRGDYAGAIELLKQISADYPDLVFVRNNLALAYYCNGQTEEAIRVSKEVLKEDPSNVHATCNLVLFGLKGDGDAAIPSEQIERLASLTADDADEEIKIALTFCEIGEDSRALEVLKQVLQETPYDMLTLFLAGAAAANTGKYREAIGYFMDMLRLEPDNTIALYYKNYVQRNLDSGEELWIDYAYQVPAAEIKQRMAYLNGCVEEGLPNLRKRWADDAVFRATLLWGFTLPDPSIKRAVVELLGKFGDERAIGELKRYLLKRSEPDEVKNDIFISLKSNGIKQPYYAYIGGKIAEIRIGMAEDRGARLKASNQKVMERLIDCADELPPELIPKAVELFMRYLAKLDPIPTMRDANAWAAALLAAVDLEQKLANMDQICAVFGAEMQAVKRRVHKLRAFIAAEKEGEDNV